MTMVICYRCLTGYNLETVPRRKTKHLKVKEPACPQCKCKVYFSRPEGQAVQISYEKSQFTSMEDDK